MSDLGEVNNVKNLEFKWGKKRGVGGNKKGVQFYESFTYDGMEYTLLDCVFVHKEGRALPYIGKLIRIWENPDKTKKVKVHWFFRPLEILHWLRDNKTLENEIFLASGEGVCVASVTHLEAIAGKCNVVCTSKDSRNLQPLVEELQMADYIFYRTFDVGHYTISDKMGDKVAGMEVKFIFNRKECERVSSVPKLESDEKGDNMDTVAYNKRLQLCKKNLSEDFRAGKTEGNSNHLEAKEDEVLKHSSVREFLAGEKLASGAGLGSNDLAINSGEGSSALDDKTKTRCMVDDDKEDVKKVIVIPVNQVAIKESVQSYKDSDTLDNKPSKKARVNSSVKLSEDKNMNSDKKLTIHGNAVKSLAPTVTSADRKARSGLGKDTFGLGKEVKSARDFGDLEDRPPKKVKVDISAKLSTDKNRNNVQSSSNNFKGTLKDKVSTVTNYKEKAKSRIVKDFIAFDKGLPEKQLDERISKLSNSKFLTASARVFLDEEKTEGEGFEVNRRPDVDKSKWFRALPFEERMKNAHEQGTLVLLRNVDPEYTSAEVEDIIWHGFKENCTAKMIQHATLSSPHSGQALVIFKTREAAERATRKLDKGCLMLSDGRPLVGSVATPSFPGKQSTFFGHLFIDKIKFQMQSEMKQAVSTSHCSQPNTIEYEMAMEWCLLQERSESSWKRLYKQQGEELRKLKANLKSK
ncbi:protein ANTI-SILENCING 1-like [Cornus florida]|uniref:protein ANTI-SILENCING 1-like n=1 Tax=Cornus florida TaxID=4283 RepID=UPI00289CC3DD|nr:protein ANTI-SILENCING 1-like [Cornus florida]XP_059640364.1 protein ANTI-SILENCING 1-like [Cornus florida]